MRRIFVAAIAVFALGAAPALAADMALRPAPVRPAPVVYTWTGCFIGGNVGFGWQRNHPFDPTTPTIDMGSDTGTGIVGGGQVGCDYQFAGNWVAGVAGMFDGAEVNGSHLIPFAYSGDNSESMAFKTDWLAMVTGRVGYAITPQALLYAKGGGAWVHTKYTDTDPSGATFPPFSGQGSTTLNGWTVGGGLEYAFWPNWSVFLEYDYIGLNTPTVSLSYSCAAPCGFTNPYPYQENHHFQMVLLGLNYRFGFALGH
jgi:outer membrane immunogenic protein